MPATIESTPVLPGLSPVLGREIVARFDADHMSSDGGLLVPREIEQRLGIAKRLAGCIRTHAIRHGSNMDPTRSFAFAC